MKTVSALLLTICTGACAFSAESLLNQQWRLVKMMSQSNPTSGFVFAPNAIHEMMGILMIGSSGPTSTALEKNYFLNQTRETTAHAMSNLTRRVGGYRSLTGLWSDTDTAILPSFKQTLEETGNVYVSKAPLNSQKARSAEIVNKWFQDQTDMPSIHIIRESDLTGTLALIAVNLSAFRQQWAEGLFKSSHTAPEKFYPTKGRHITVSMMKTQQKLEFTEDDKVSAIVLPYLHPELNLLVVLPKTPGTLREWIQGTNSSPLRDLKRKMQHQEAKVWLPKFNGQHQENWRELWIKNNLSIPFEPSPETEFAHINNNHPLRLYMSVMKQISWVRWDEWGTVARADTTLRADPFGAPPTPVPPKRFIVNHPFFFAVIHKETLEMFFAGIVTEPGQPQ